MSARKTVAVVGGGLVGLCSALHLAEAGSDVLLIDYGDPRRAASFGNACQIAVGEVVPLAAPGVIRSVPKWLGRQGPLSIDWRYLPRLLPWLIRFLRQARTDRFERTSAVMAALCEVMWQDYVPLIEAAGVQSLFRASDYIRVYEDEEQWREEGPGWALRERAGLRFELVRGVGLRAVEPELASRFQFGVILKGRRTVRDPQRVMAAFGALLVSRAGRMVTGSAVGFEVRGDAVRRVRLADGSSIEVDEVVIAAGAWSHRLVRELGDRVPLESERGYHVLLRDPGIAIERTVSFVAKGLVAVPVENGLRLAGIVEFAGLEAPPNPALPRRLLDAARTVFPRLNVAGAEPWMGHRPSLPDALPIIDRASQVGNVIYAFGHGHMGLSWAATTGRLVCDISGGRPSHLDRQPFRLSRFRA